MRNFLKGLIGAAVLLTGSPALLSSPASAQGVRIEIGPRGVEVDRVSFCDRNPRARECRRDDRRWDRHDRRWDRHDRRGDRRYDGPGRVSRASVARCAQRYRSYDPRTHTYVVNSRGDRRVCQL